PKSNRPTAEPVEASTLLTYSDRFHESAGRPGRLRPAGVIVRTTDFSDQPITGGAVSSLPPQTSSSSVSHVWRSCSSPPSPPGRAPAPIGMPMPIPPRPPMLPLPRAPGPPTRPAPGPTPAPSPPGPAPTPPPSPGPPPGPPPRPPGPSGPPGIPGPFGPRSEEHTSELQSRENLVCRLLLEKKTPSQAEFHRLPELRRRR